MSADLHLYLNVDQSELHGMIEAYVGDRIATGNEIFQEECQLTKEVFDSKHRTFNSFTFAGIS